MINIFNYDNMAVPKAKKKVCELCDICNKICLGNLFENTYGKSNKIRKDKSKQKVIKVYKSKKI